MRMGAKWEGVLIWASLDCEYTASNAEMLQMILQKNVKVIIRYN